MTFNIWVSRLAASRGGDPSRSCPISLNRKQIKENVYRFRKTVSPLDCEIVSDNSIVDNLIVELFENGKLRQGWGMTYENMNTDLRQDLDDWVENYLNLIWKLYGEKKDCAFACARYEIMNQMRLMEKDDIIFIPRIPDYSMFTVSTVKEKYKFEPLDGYVEFGHVIKVIKKNTLAFQYEDFMPAKIFNPYQKAVSEVKEHHQNYLVIKKFIDEIYLNVLKNQ